MARQIRKKSGTGIYHVMLRGINRQDIFEDDVITRTDPMIPSIFPFEYSWDSKSSDGSEP